MIDDLQLAVSRSLHLPPGALLGLETVSRERWRVWMLSGDPDASTLQLALISLRSQSSEPAFDVLFTLTLSWYHPLEKTDPSGLSLQVWQLVCDYLRSRRAPRPEQAWWSELAEASCCPWCDATDRLWAVQIEVGPGEPPLPLFVVWLHERLLFLAEAMDEALVRLLALAQDALPLFPRREEKGSSSLE